MERQSSISSFLSTQSSKRKKEEPRSPLNPIEPSQIVSEVAFTESTYEDYNLNSQPLALSDPKFNPILDSKFKYGDPVPFRMLVDAFEEVSKSKGANSKNLQKEVLSNLFRSIILLKPDHLVKCFYLCIGKLCPDYTGIEIGIGKEALFKAAARNSGLTVKQVRKQENQTGDLGTVVSNGKATQKNLTSYFTKRTKLAPLTIENVYDSLWKIATYKGNNSISLKEEELVRLLNQADSEEAKYIIRILQKSLKIGASELTMQSALAKAIAVTPPKQGTFPPSVLKASEEGAELIENTLKRAINECPDYDKIIKALLEVGPQGKDISYISEVCRITPGVPVKPMLANPTKGIQEILKRFTGVEFTCEFKYDGMRAQIHILEDRSVKIYSRGNEDITEMYPDIVQFLAEHIDYSQVTSCIIDSEAVAFDSKTSRIRPFQDIQHRGRKNVDINSIEINVCIFPFDMLFYNSESILDKSLFERRELLKKAIKEEPGKLQFAEHRDLSLFEDIEAFLLESVKIGCEGLMVKTLHDNASYEPAKRSLNWLKLKKDYMQASETSLSDSVDLVPIGAYYGTGKRVGVYGSFLLAIYDSSNDEYQTICKTATGFSEEQLKTLYSKLKPFEIPKPLKNYRYLHTDLDVWFEPKLVCEVLGADLSISPKHTSAWCQAAEDKGISLRFPRFLRLREDKSPTEATSPEQVVSMYYNQSAIHLSD